MFQKMVTTLLGPTIGACVKPASSPVWITRLQVEPMARIDPVCLLVPLTVLDISELISRHLVSAILFRNDNEKSA